MKSTERNTGEKLKIMLKKRNSASYFLFPGTIGIEELPKYLVINLVKLEICNMYELTMQEIRATNKKNVLPRHIMCHLMYNISKKTITYKEIGEEVNRDHATVMHACRKISDWMQTNDEFRVKILKLENKIKGFC